MRRAIVVPPDLAGDALDELKHWLAITTPHDDAALIAYLQAAHEACEGFTGIVPLSSIGEEVLAARMDWQWLGASPVSAILAVAAIDTDGTRHPLPADGYLIDIAANGRGRVRLLQRVPESRLAVQFDAGMAPDWSLLPAGLRHGIVRLAAHHYRERGGEGESAVPPSSVSASWQPWRRMRLA